MTTTGKQRSGRQSRIRNTMEVKCPRPETLGCEDFGCNYDPQICDTECLEEVVPCLMCSNNGDCERSVKEQLFYIHRAEKSKKDIIEAHDDIQDEIMEIYKYWKSMKMRQKWTAKEKLKDMIGQLKGLRWALHKLDVPFYPKFLTGMRIEDTMLAYYKKKEEDNEEEY